MTKEQAQKILKITSDSYEKIASEFSLTRQQAWPEVGSAVKKYVKDSDKILDLGCGNGRLLLSLQKTDLKNIDYIGIDNSSMLIDKAQDLKKSFNHLTIQPFNHLSFIKQNILDLQNFKNNTFDVVFMVASFNHIPSQELRQKVLNEIYRILKSGGKIIMTNWNLWNFKNKKSIWQARPGRAGLRDRDALNAFKDVMTLWQNKHPLYYRVFTLHELTKLFKNSKFKILENKFIKDGQSAHWWNAKNILTIGEK